MQKTRHSIVAALVMGLVLSFGLLPAAADDHATYEVTITNQTYAQWFTPPAAATHDGSVAMFTKNQQASYEIQQIAENGNLTPMVGLLGSASGVTDWAVAVSNPIPPLAPGASITFTLEGAPGDRLSFASMLICTNDGFAGIDGMLLPVHPGQTQTRNVNAYDAGTEVNTEAWSDLVPPCAMLTGFGDQGGTGMSNPALAEGGVIRLHKGIKGFSDLMHAVHDWTGPVATIEVTRLG